MNVTSIIAKGYENKPRFRAKAKQTQYKPNSNPNKPNFKGGIIIKKMNIEVEVEVADPASFWRNPAFRGRNQTQPVVTLPGVFVSSIIKASYVFEAALISEVWYAQPPY